MECLIRHHADVNADGGEEGKSALFVAANEGCLPMVEQLLHHGANVNKAGDLQQTPLYRAARHGHTEMVAYLIEYGADVNLADEDGDSPLYRAVTEEHYDIVECLVKSGADFKRELKLSYPLYYWAAKVGNKEVMQTLVQHTGIDIDKVDDVTSQTALLKAAKRGHLSVVEYLLELHQEGRHLEINHVDLNGYSSLWQAADEGHLEVATLLVKNGAIVTMSDKKGQTPLYRASFYGRTDMVKLLIAHGASVNQPDHLLMTPLYLTIQGGGAGESFLAVVEALVEAGADVNTTVSSPEVPTPLHCACFMGHIAIVMYLAERVTDKNVRNSAGQTPLMLAVTAGHMDVVEYLVGVSNVDLNKIDFTSHQSVLHIAVGSSLAFGTKTTTTGIGIIPYLLNHQADASIRNRNGKTCFDLMKVASLFPYFLSYLPLIYPFVASVPSSVPFPLHYICPHIMLLLFS